jgi:cystathionine gamma-synthase
VDHDALAPATTVVALGRQERVPGAGVNAPLELTSTYLADGAVNYARVGNPTWSAFEEVLGALEGGEALLFSSGMAACDAALSLVPVGAVVVAPANAYNGVVVTLTERAAAGEIAVRWVDLTDLESVAEALAGAALLWIESPTNPLLDVADLPALVALARTAGALTVCDSTFATPLLQQPLSDGVDVVVHSATKYLSGHSDVVLGATVTADTEAGRALRERLHRHRTLHGAIAGPMEAWLAVRGIRTLALRFERACANAAELARRLQAHPAVARVRYPGSGAIVSIETGSADSAEALATRTRLWVHATSLGGVESSLERRRRQPGEPETTPVDLVRLSVGIEDVEDLWRDLDRALGPAG